MKNEQPYIFIHKLLKGLYRLLADEVGRATSNFKNREGNFYLNVFYLSVFLSRKYFFLNEPVNNNT